MKTSLLFLSLFFSAITSGWSFTSASFDQEIIQNGETLATFKIAMDQKLVRAESTLGDATTVMIRNSDGNFTYFPEQKMAYRIPEDQNPNIVDDIADYSAFLTRNNAAKVGEEVINEMACDVYEYKDPISGEPSKTWVWKEKNFPLQVEVTTQDGVVRVAFTNVQLDQPMAEDSFKLPEGTDVYDLSQPNPADPSTTVPTPAAP